MRNVVYDASSITIPSSINSIGEDAFEYSHIRKVYINDLASWCNIEFGNKSSNPLNFAGNLYLNSELVTELVIPDNVTSISNYTFNDCQSLTRVVIGDSVISIGDYAFDDCKSLTSVVISDSVTTIGNRAFSGCIELTDVYYTGTEEEWESVNIGSGNGYLTNSTIHYNYVPEE